MAGALDVPVKHVEVDIAKEDIKLPKLPKLELCEGKPRLGERPCVRAERG